MSLFKEKRGDLSWTINIDSNYEVVKIYSEMFDPIQFVESILIKNEILDGK